jgi:hypothetical protein
LEPNRSQQPANLAQEHALLLLRSRPAQALQDVLKLGDSPLFSRIHNVLRLPMEKSVPDDGVSSATQ